MWNTNLICFHAKNNHLQRCIPCEVKTSTAVMASHTEKIVKEFCFNKIFLNLEIGVGETAEGALLDKLGCVGASCLRMKLCIRIRI